VVFNVILFSVEVISPPAPPPPPAAAPPAPPPATTRYCTEIGVEVEKLIVPVPAVNVVILKPPTVTVEAVKPADTVS
jgi:hypothetical protein